MNIDFKHESSEVVTLFRSWYTKKRDEENTERKHRRHVKVKKESIKVERKNNREGKKKQNEKGGIIYLT
jgi:hypothetical protein